MNTANYVLLDAAKMRGEMEKARELNPEHICLYEGDSERFLGAVAPWLFDLEDGSDFAAWLSEAAQSNSWGVFIRCNAEPNELYTHLRKFLVVATEDGRELYFRYYDPRVLREFLPTCDKQQLLDFFGPIEAFLAEDENGLLVEYALGDGLLQLQSSNKVLTDVFEQKPVLRNDQISPENSPPINESSEAGPPSAPEDQSSHPPAPKTGEEEDSDQNDEDGTPARKNSGWDFGY